MARRPREGTATRQDFAPHAAVKEHVRRACDSAQLKRAWSPEARATAGLWACVGGEPTTLTLKT